jgi:hypothetical protein
MRVAQYASVIALGILGMIGGCIILSQDGFTTSSKRGHWSIFVSTPEAYVMAAIMFSMSMVAVIWLLTQSKVRFTGYAVSFALYIAAVFSLTKFLSSVIQ